MRKILKKINEKFGVYLFNNSNTLNNNFFNYLYKKKIAKKTNDEEIYKFHKDGYFKTSVNSEKICEYLSKKIVEQDPVINEKRNIYFKIDDEMKKKIKDHIYSNFGDTFKKFEKYFNNKIAISNISLKRNYYVDDVNYYKNKIRDKSKEFYNMYFHCDANTLNYFKLFISINDIDKTQGPLTFYSIPDNRKFLKKSNYKSRNNYIDIELGCIKQNVSKRGESLFISTPQCLHRAGIPEYGKHRDILVIVLIATSEKINDYFHYEKNFYDEIWNRGGTSLQRVFSKPIGFRGAFSNYKKFLKSKLI